MKHKYAIGERVLFRHTKAGEPTAEHIGMVTTISYEYTKQGVTVAYLVNGTLQIPDSDILGRVTLQKAPAPRKSRSKKATAPAPVQTDWADMANGRDLSHEGRAPEGQATA